MSIAIVTWLEAELAKAKAALSPAEAVVVSDAEAIGDAAFNYIKTNGLADLYKIATAALLGAVTGTPWATIATSVVSQGEAAGITIAKGAESIVLASAQADLIAAGQLVAPTTGTVVAPVAAAPAA